jgi:starch-binding outer membrane protein, SusD/RagB family
MKVSAVFALAAVLGTACVNKDEFFELPDRAGIDANIWSTEGAVEMHLRETYDMSAPRFPHNESYDRLPIHMASDENYFSGNDQWAKAALGLEGTLANNDVRFVGNRYRGSTFGDNRYYDIARSNNAIAYIPAGSIPEATKKKILGQYYFLRAFTYFELVKVYGGVPLIVTPQSPGSLNVSGRASAKECFDQILSDLESSISNLDGVVWGNSDLGRINKEIATVMKAKVLLYWASPQFNPNNDAARWAKALDANKTAHDLCVANGRTLVSNYKDIFLLEGTENKEAIFVRPYSNKVERRGHNTENRVRPNSEGGSSNNAFIPTTILLNAYPMRDGNLPGQPGAYAYDDVMFWQNRDPRFEATFAVNGSVWPLSGKAGRKQWNYTNATNNGVTESGNYGVYSKRFSNPTIPQASVAYAQNLGGSGMDWIELRLAEVMLNYAECANATGDISTAKDMVRKIRQRAGIEQGTNDYGLGSVTGAGTGMLDLITNERFIEFAFENKRNADLRRLRKWHTLSGTISTIRISLKNTNQKAILEAQSTTNPAVQFRDQLDINNKAVYNTYFQKVFITPNNIGTFSIPEHHYFYTFHNDFMASSPLLEHTIGWENGTFDPLK